MHVDTCSQFWYISVQPQADSGAYDSSLGRAGGTFATVGAGECAYLRQSGLLDLLLHLHGLHLKCLRRLCLRLGGISSFVIRRKGHLCTLQKPYSKSGKMQELERT